MRTIGAIAFAATVLSAAPAMAQRYSFTVTDASQRQSGYSLDNNQYNFDLTVPAGGVADSDPFQFVLRGVTTYQVTYPGNAPTQYSLVGDDFTFYVDPNDELGGLDTPLGSYLGPQLFMGSTDHPVFKLGSFTLDNGRSISIRLSNATAAVPEPAAWGMMILGFGVVGAAMRRRIRASEVRFDAKIKRISEGASA